MVVLKPLTSSPLYDQTISYAFTVCASHFPAYLTRMLSSVSASGALSSAVLT